MHNGPQAGTDCSPWQEPLNQDSPDEFLLLQSNNVLHERGFAGDLPVNCDCVESGFRRQCRLLKNSRTTRAKRTSRKTRREPMVSLQAALAAIAISGFGQTVLLDFYADWCGPCRAMNPTVEALIAAGYPVQRVNIDQNRPLAAKYGIQSIPCFVMVVDGREVDRVEGGTTYSRLERMCKAGASAAAPPRRRRRLRKTTLHRPTDRLSSRLRSFRGTQPPAAPPPALPPRLLTIGCFRPWPTNRRPRRRRRRQRVRCGSAGGQRAGSRRGPGRRFLRLGHDHRRPRRRGPGADLRPPLPRLAGQGANHRRPVHLGHAGASSRPTGLLFL